MISPPRWFNGSRFVVLMVALQVLRAYDKNNPRSPFPPISHQTSHGWLHQQNQNQSSQCFIKLYCKMCLHNAVEVSFLTTYIKNFWTQVCGRFSILTLHGTEKKKKGVTASFQTVKWGKWGEKRQMRGMLKRKSPWFTLNVTKLRRIDTNGR